MRFLFINGPNINITRFTEPGVEGEVDYNGLLDYLDVCCQQMGIEPDFFQSNHEGDIIDEIQSAAGRADGIILNPGGYAYYSVAILEALQLCGVPAVEVLMSEPSAALNILLNFVCINIFGYFAAGYTTLYCYIVFTIYHYCFMVY